MGRRRDPAILRVESRVYSLGYAKPVGRRWKIFVGSERFSTDLLATKETVPLVRPLIDQRVEEVLARRRSADRGTAPVRPSLYAVVDMWYVEHVTNNPRAGAKYGRIVQFALQAYSVPGRDLILEPSQECVSRIATQFSEIRAARQNPPPPEPGERSPRPESAGTTATYLRVWRRVFAWAVRMGWIPTNPIELLSLPTVPRKSEDKRMYTPQEFSALLDAAQTDDPEYFRLYRFLFLTGMRISEALAIEWKDIIRSTIRIHGKGYAGEKKLRYFPLRSYPDGTPAGRWQSEIREILEAQRGTGDGYVWSWRDRGEIWYAMERHKRQAGIEHRDKRAFHTFRAMSEHFLQYDIGLPLPFCAALLGHSVTVAESRYSLLAVPEHMTAALDRFVSKTD